MVEISHVLRIDINQCMSMMTKKIIIFTMNSRYSAKNVSSKKYQNTFGITPHHAFKEEIFFKLHK